MASSNRLFGLSSNTVAWTSMIAAIAISLGAFGGYRLGKDAALKDNARDELLRQSTN